MGEAAPGSVNAVHGKSVTTVEKLATSPATGTVLHVAKGVESVA